MVAARSDRHNRPERRDMPIIEYGPKPHKRSPIVEY
jgi:hypothetical protein